MAPKRAQSPSRDAGSKSTTTPSRLERSGEEVDERGEFEDAWEDEFEKEDIQSGDEDDDHDDGAGHLEGVNGDKDTGMEEDLDAMGIRKGGNQADADEDEDDQEPESVPYLPGLGQGEKLADDEELVADMSSYEFLHHARLTWPCLSFDVLRDNEGEQRMKGPFNACLVAGTQADATGGPSSSNEVVVMRFEGMHKNKRKGNDDDDDVSDDDDDDDDNSEDGLDDEAVLTYRSIPHNGGVNRIRAQQIPLPYSTPAPEPPNGHYHVATFSETGKVHIYDIAPHLASLQNPSSFSAADLNNKPVHSVEAHKRAEGFALAWSTPLANATQTRLLSGDIHAKIHMTVMTSTGFQTSSSMAFSSHTSSIEDIQWSPSESTVFGSVSADRSLRLWDIRVRERTSVLAATDAHDSDINVMSWNASQSYLIVTGGDEGGLKVWDLRTLSGGKKGAGNKSSAAPVASFDWHKSPITSVEWHPTEESCFAASSADDSVTLWDLAVEKDEEEKAQAIAQGGDKMNDVPDQLLFIHQGQKEIKELHWHPQIPGTVISTSLENFAVFKTISV